MHGVDHRARRAFRVIEVTVTRRVVDRPEDGVISKSGELQRRENQHGIALFQPYRREKFERECVVFKFVQERGVEG